MDPVNDKKIHSLILSTVEAYQDASTTFPPSQITISASYHARFLRNLVLEDSKLYPSAESERSEESMAVDTRMQG